MAQLQGLVIQNFFSASYLGRKIEYMGNILQNLKHV